MKKQKRKTILHISFKMPGVHIFIILLDSLCSGSPRINNKLGNNKLSNNDKYTSYMHFM